MDDSTDWKVKTALMESESLIKTVKNIRASRSNSREARSLIQSPRSYNIDESSNLEHNKQSL